ncbi:Imm45 family immunity protein [Rhizobium alvei]|uniref:Imm45 family immunity protein n=1 Tax=Rhizobium alvei TaxID=1132659 RepID=A0ABT8YQ59_9HYPH|nr:Imm45 family immunity protein [Rhizobium alvei]MDO6965452.1 Imm45 family immunity protein [Rhizobium alvei]
MTETWSSRGISTRRWTPLADLRDTSLWRGDVIRLPHHPEIGPDSRPVDLLIYELWGYDQKLGLMITKGYKAGMPLFYAPKESQGEGKLSLETSWLHANWNKWFVYNYELDENENPVPMPMTGTLVRRNSRPAPRLNV